MRDRGGFTLLELIVVLSILAGLLAVVAPSLSGGLESGRMRAAASDIRATLSHARTLSVGNSRIRAVTFDLDNGKRQFSQCNRIHKHTQSDISKNAWRLFLIFSLRYFHTATKVR